jgi:hypothetical protein
MSNAPAQEFWPKTSRWTRWKIGQKYLHGVRWWSPRHHQFVSTLQLPSRGFDFRSSPVPGIFSAKEKIACDQMLRVCGPVNEWVFKKLRWLFFRLECCLQCKTSNTAREESNLGTGTDKPEIGLLISARQLASVRIISVSPENLEVLKFLRWGKEQVNNASIILIYIYILILHMYHNYCRYQLCYSCLQIVLVSMPKDIQFSLRGGPYSGFCTDKHWWWYDGVWWVVWWLWLW